MKVSMKNRYALVSVCVALLVVVLSSCGTKVGSISGKVVNAAGAPVEGVSVEVAGQSVLTDQDGNYALSDVAVGNHRITATKSGVGTLTSEVTVRASVTTTFDIALTPVNE